MHNINKKMNYTECKNNNTINVKEILILDKKTQRTVKIHKKLKWCTIIQRINEYYGYKKYIHNQYGKIFKWHDNEGAYFFYIYDTDKQHFINKEICYFNIPMDLKYLEDEKDLWFWDEEMETGYYA